MPRAGLSPSAVVGLALAQLDEGGADSLTLATVAGRAGVAVPSLYKHVAGLPGLRSMAAAEILGDLADALESSSASSREVSSDPEQHFRRMLHAWREYARVHPRRYSFLPLQPLAEPALAEAAERLVGAVVDAVAELIDRAPGSAETLHATRAVRSAVHGFAVLEADGGFGLPLDLDESFERLVDLLVTALRAA